MRVRDEEDSWEDLNSTQTLRRLLKCRLLTLVGKVGVHDANQKGIGKSKAEFFFNQSKTYKFNVHGT